MVQVLIEIKDYHPLALAHRADQLDPLSDDARLTVDSDPFVDVHILGRSDDGLETPLDESGLDERLAEVQWFLLDRTRRSRWELGGSGL